ncbi:MAG: hypothetical protein J1E65_00270 [Lachnospiraceae bacterium]|nr:hypothetical protein [Lachnospiraceae bacterium]
MEPQTKTRLLYEWNTKYNKLDFAITEAEFQLASVNKRLRMLWYDLAAYIGMIIVPWLICQLLSLIPENATSFISVILSGMSGIIMMLFSFSLPILVYYLMKSVLMLILNSESKAESEFSPPKLQGLRHGAKIEPEKTYRIEQKKLVYVLSRYYLSRDALNELYKELDSDACTITLEELNDIFKQYPLYEDIRPASATVLWKKWRKNGLVIMVFAIIIGALIIWALMGYLSQVGNLTIAN